jgi:hypothetical protein
MGLKTRYTIALSPRCCVVEREGGCITRL